MILSFSASTRSRATSFIVCAARHPSLYAAFSGLALLMAISAGRISKGSCRTCCSQSKSRQQNTAATKSRSVQVCPVAMSNHPEYPVAIYATWRPRNRVPSPSRERRPYFPSLKFPLIRRRCGRQHGLFFGLQSVPGVKGIHG